MAGRPEAVVHACRLRKSAHAISMRKPGGIPKPEKFGNWLKFAFAQHSGRVAIAVLHDRERLYWRDGVARNAGTFERLRIGAGDEWKGPTPEAPDRADVNRVIRGGSVEFLARRPALLRQDVGHVEVKRRIADRHDH